MTSRIGSGSGCECYEQEGDDAEGHDVTGLKQDLMTLTCCPSDPIFTSPDG